MQLSSPSMSFIIPCWNEEALLGDCIASIRQEMASTSVEIIVVDNGCTDATVAIAELLGCRVVVEPDKGVVRARQAGYLASKAPFLVFMDADSRIPPGWLQVVVQTMLEEGVVACSGPLLFDELRMHKRILTAFFYSCGVLISWWLPMLQGGNCVVMRRALDAVNGFDLSIEFYAEDTATAIRLAKVGRVKMVPDMFVYSSARRMNAEGFVRVGLRYMANYFWMAVLGRVWTRSHIDHRE